MGLLDLLFLYDAFQLVFIIFLAVYYQVGGGSIVDKEDIAVYVPHLATGADCHLLLRFFLLILLFVLG